MQYIDIVRLFPFMLSSSKHSEFLFSVARSDLSQKFATNPPVIPGKLANSFSLRLIRLQRKRDPESRNGVGACGHTPSLDTGFRRYDGKEIAGPYSTDF